MSRWPAVSLGSVALIGAGNSAPQGEEHFLTDGIPFIRTSDVGAVHIGEIDDARDHLAETTAASMKKFPAGTILIPKSGASTFTNHRVMMTRPAVISSHLAGVVADESKVLARFLFYTLQNVRAQDLVQDHSYPSLKTSIIGKISIPLPPLDEQKRIVAKLDGLSKQCLSLSSVWTRQIDEGTQLREAITETFLRDAGQDFESFQLGEIFEIARGGSPRPIKEYLTEDADGLNWIKISDASRTGKYITDTAQRIKRSGVTKTRLVKSGDFLLTNSMSFGRPYLLKTDGCIHDGWLVLSPLSEKIDPEYMYYALASREAFKQFDALAQGSTVRNLNIASASRVRVPLPPLSEQQLIASRLAAVDGLSQQLQESLNVRKAHLQDFQSKVASSVLAGIST